jgi:cyclopropane fatty-acyl-phospholipid synthase-like methyltransferase
VGLLQGWSPFEIVERDDGYIDAANSTGQYFAEFKVLPERQKLGMKFVRGDNALDVGCGAGRVSLYLQSKGVRVTAIDSSPLAVRTCKKRGVKNARVLPFEDIERIREGGFTTVVMFGNNFGLFGNVRKAKRLLKQLHRMTTEEQCSSLKPSIPTERPTHYTDGISGAIGNEEGWQDRFVYAYAFKQSLLRGSTTSSCRRTK